MILSMWDGESMLGYSVALHLLTNSNWGRLQDNEKIAVLQAIENEVATREYRNPCQIVSEYIPSDEDGITLGYYNRGNRLITINAEQFDPQQKYGDDYRTMVETVLHEGRHAYQHQAVLGEIEHSNPDELAAWSENMQPGHYITFERNPRGYYNQPIEKDARNFASEYLNLLENEKEELIMADQESYSYGRRLVRDEQELRETGANNIEDILEACRDDLRDKGMQDGPEMEAIIDRERIDLQMDFDRNAFGSLQDDEARVALEEQMSGFQIEGSDTIQQDRTEIDMQMSPNNEPVESGSQSQVEDNDHNIDNGMSY